MNELLERYRLAADNWPKKVDEKAVEVALLAHAKAVGQKQTKVRYARDARDALAARAALAALAALDALAALAAPDARAESWERGVVAVLDRICAIP